MTEPGQHAPQDLPSSRALALASVVAAIVVAVLGVTVVLPAETGRDPTGVGAWLGLTGLGALKQVGPPPEAPEPTFEFSTDTLSIRLLPGKGKEVKAVMRAGVQLVYRWNTTDSPVYYDFHGEPEGAAQDVFTSFEAGTGGRAEGSFEAPFAGVHGWYWENRTRRAVTVELSTTGVYASIAPK